MSDDNSNGNNGSDEGAGEGARAETIGEGSRIVRGAPHQRSEFVAIFERFMAEAFPNRSKEEATDE
ncbi:hypothetical protein [Streptomyces sp. Root1310]|uniref:hypothetical protein n=1 Tax=Streptomyces sp. Root1310 TaxID=1736452 RepID=UPI00070D6F80|nr:hypothetical protein [Streptomyces sp. Root1310]KQX82336.1 hypothetical protein ASD48_03305 [Streptomyces sp. Root1310]